MRDLLIVVGSSGLLPPNHPIPPHPTTTKIGSSGLLSPNNSTSPYSSTTKIHKVDTKHSLCSTISRPLLLNNFLNHQNQNQNGTYYYYADLASKLAKDGRLEDFLLIAETVLVSNSDPSLLVSSLNLEIVSAGVSTLICDGRLHSVVQFFTKINKLGIIPSALVNKSVKKLLALECRRLVKARKLKEVVDLMETLTGFLFLVKDFVEPCEIFQLCAEESNPETAVRYACMLPNAPTFFSSVILKFGKKGDLMSAVIAYEAFTRKSDEPNMYVCRTMIDVCGLCGDFLESRQIYEALVAQNVTPNAYVFNSLMNVNAHDLSYSLQVYKHMKNSGVTPDLASYNILLKACCCAGRVDLAQDTYEEVKQIALMGRLKLDVITYSTIIKVFADAKMWHMALRIKEDMLSAGVTPSVVTWSSLISACANAGLVEQAIEVFEEMLLADCEPNSRCYNSLLYACVEACQYDRAFRIFKSWRESGFQKSRHSRTCNASRQAHIGTEKSSENCITNSQRCYSGPFYLSFSKVVPFTPTIATFNIMMKACGTDYYRAKALMDEIKISGLSPNHISWSILIDICGSTGNVGGSVQALKAMRDCGIKPDVIAYTTTIKACVRNKSLKLAFSLFDEMKKYQLKPNLVTYNTLLRARRRYGCLQEVQQCLAIYQDMRKAGYRPNDYFLKELIEEWCEGVIKDNNRDAGIVGHSDSHDQTHREAPQCLLLEKVSAHLQRDISKSLVVDLRGLTKVEARIVVLAVLRMIKEKYTTGEVVEDDIVIIIGVGNHKYSVQEDAVIKLLQDELGLGVVLGGPPNPIESSGPARRPAVLRRVIKVTKKSLYHWLLHKRLGPTVCALSH